MHVDVWFDFASTYSYPAAERVEALAAPHGIHVRWRPIVLGAVFSQQGLNDSPFNVNPVKGRYMWRDLERICSDLDIPFNRPATFPQNGLLGARIVTQHADAAWAGTFVRGLFAANFVHGLDIAERDTVAQCLVEAGAEPDAVIAASTTDSAKAALREQTEHAMALGIFGAPTLSLRGELFWGNDRLERALQWAVDTSTKD